MEEDHTVGKLAEGPWGTIEYFYTYLEAPDALMERFPLPSTITRWACPRMELVDLNAKLRELGLGESHVSELLAGHSLSQGREWIYLFPSMPLLSDMPRDTRSKLYVWLRQHSPNLFHVSPVLFPSGSVASWAEQTDLAPEFVTRLEAWTYDRQGIQAFSDIPALLRQAQGEKEAREIYRQLTRTRTIMARLVLTPNTQLNSILEYWTTGLNLRRKELEPMLRPILKTQGANHLDIVHLLPALARKLVYTYPDSEMMDQGLLPDCHWTTLNFFSYSTQNYYLTQEAATSAVLENFETVDPPYRFGDVLMFLNEKGSAIHSCNYIAADLVFTKNGRTPVMPWMLMELEDLGKIYGVKEDGARIQGFRHKKSVSAGK